MSYLVGVGFDSLGMIVMRSYFSCEARVAAFSIYSSAFIVLLFFHSYPGYKWSEFPTLRVSKTIL